MRVDTLLGVLEQTGVDGLCSSKSGSKILNELNMSILDENNEVENDGIPHDGQIQVPLECFMISYM